MKLSYVLAFLIAVTGIGTYFILDGAVFYETRYQAHLVVNGKRVPNGEMNVIIMRDKGRMEFKGDLVSSDLSKTVEARKVLPFGYIYCADSAGRFTPTRNRQRNSVTVSVDYQHETSACKKTTIAFSDVENGEYRINKSASIVLKRIDPSDELLNKRQRDLFAKLAKPY